MKLRILCLITLGFCILSATSQASTTETAIFAGGCFWCVESDFDKIPGVNETVSGYIGGHVHKPTYGLVSAGVTGHTEAVKITFDPNIISYKKLLDVFWLSIDPTTKNSQFCDHGSQYRTGIFYTSDAQRELAEISKQALAQSKSFQAPIVTEITQATAFYAAEEYHQNYYKKIPCVINSTVITAVVINA